MGLGRLQILVSYASPLTKTNGSRVCSVHRVLDKSVSCVQYLDVDVDFSSLSIASKQLEIGNLDQSHYEIQSPLP